MSKASVMGETICNESAAIANDTQNDQLALK